MAILAFASFTVYASSNNWTSFTLNNNNTRYQQNAGINSTNIGTLNEHWQIVTDYPVTSTPIVSNGKVYFTDWGGYVYSANITSGSINWETNLGHAISDSRSV